MFEETLTEVEKEAMTVASVICMEGLDIESCITFICQTAHISYTTLLTLFVRENGLLDAAQKAVRLYPSYYPDYLAEEIEEYL